MKNIKYRIADWIAGILLIPAGFLCLLIPRAKSPLIWGLWLLAYVGNICLAILLTHKAKKTHGSLRVVFAVLLWPIVLPAGRIAMKMMRESFRWKGYIYQDRPGFEIAFGFVGEFSTAASCRGAVQKSLNLKVPIKLDYDNGISSVAANSWFCGRGCFLPLEADLSQDDIRLDQLECSEIQRGK